MKYINELKERLCEELEEIAEKGDLSAGDLEAAHKLTDTIKNIDKIMVLEEDGYSNDGDWEARGAYARRMGGERYGRRGTQRYYSRDSGTEHDRKSIERALSAMMEEADGNSREVLSRALNELRKA